jgi:hypothetical protein
MFIDPAPPGQPFWATDIETGETLTYPKGHDKEGQPLFKRRFIPARLSGQPLFVQRHGDYEDDAVVSTRDINVVSLL